MHFNLKILITYLLHKRHEPDTIESQLFAFELYSSSEKHGIS